MRSALFPANADGTLNIKTVHTASGIHQSCDPWACFSPLAVCMVYDITHCKVRNSIQEFGNCNDRCCCRCTCTNYVCVIYQQKCTDCRVHQVSCIVADTISKSLKERQLSIRIHVYVLHNLFSLYAVVIFSFSSQQVLFTFQ